MFKIFRRKYVAGIDVTNKCNLRCRYCYHKKHLTEQEDIPLSEWERRFKEYKKMGIRNTFFIGGEPCLRYDVFLLANKHFPYVSVFTNGQIKIPEEFNHRIFLSVDGSKKYNDKNRGEGTYEQAVSNYLGDKRVVINSVISKENYNNLQDFIDEIKNLGIQGAMFSFYSPQNGENNSLVLSPEERLKVGRVLKKELERKDSILLMTKEMVDYLIKFGPSKRCACKENILFFTSGNQKKYCVNESVDCSRCGCLFACLSPSIFNFPGWLRHKKVIYDMFFKLS